MADRELPRLLLGKWRGIDLRTPRDQLPPDMLRTAENLLIDRGTLRLRPGRNEINATMVGTPSNYPVTGLYRDDEANKLLSVIHGKLYDHDATPSEILSAGSGSLGGSTTADYHWATFGGDVYFTEPGAGPWYYNGTNWVALAQITAPASAPTLQPSLNFICKCESVIQPLWEETDAGNTPVGIAGPGYAVRGLGIVISTTADASIGDKVYLEIDQSIWGFAWSEDGGVFAAMVTQLENATANDVVLWPATPAVNDAFYLGWPSAPVATDTQEITVLLSVGTAADGVDMTTICEYYNGATWETLTLDQDSTGGLLPTTTGLHTFRFDAPSDWASLSVSGQTMFYIRFRCTAYTGLTTTPLGTQGWWRNIPNSGTSRGLDLSGVRHLHFWARSNVAGTLFQFGFSGSSPASADFDYQTRFQIRKVGTWERIVIDISSIPDGDKDAIAYIGFRCINDDVGAQMVLDQIGYSGGLTGQYEYRYTYYNSATAQESAASPGKVVEVNNDIRQSVIVSGWGSGGSGSADQIKVYRKGGVSAIWRLVATIDDTEVLYLDRYAAHLLGAEQEQKGTPPACSFISSFANRIVWARNNTYASRLYVSSYEEPGTVPEITLLEANGNAGGYLDVEPDDGDEITGILGYADRLLIWKRGSMHVLLGTSFQDMYRKELSSELGCASQKSVAQFQNLVIWYTGEDIVQYDGQNITVLSDPVKSVIDGILVANEDDVVGVIHDQRYYFFYRTSGSVNNLGLVYDMRVGGWTTLTGWTTGIKCAVEIKGVGDQALLYGGDATSGFAWDLENGYDDSGGTTDPIEWSVVTGDYDFGERGVVKAVDRYYLSALVADEWVKVLVRGDQGVADWMGTHSFNGVPAGIEARTVTTLDWQPGVNAQGQLIRLELSGSASTEIELHSIRVDPRWIGNR